MLALLLAAAMIQNPHQASLAQILGDVSEQMLVKVDPIEDQIKDSSSKTHKSNRREDGI